MMKTLKVNLPGREYNINIGSGLLEKSGELIASFCSCVRAAIVTDSNVGPLYADSVKNSLLKSGIESTVITVAAGEKSKSISVLEKLYSEMLAFKLTRSDLIIALGGGVVGDLTGLCAATLLRGIPFVQIPTTLLAQVDSSVGGKVAVNLPEGKNLVGAFYQPKMVIIDTDCLNTLSDRIFGDGMAEVIKYGAIFSEEFFLKLKSASGRADITPIIDDVIFTCCDLKRKTVEKDETDTGERMLLNFGHTFGHAIEKRYNYEGYTHGEAVAAGMVMAAEYGESIGITPKGTANEIKSVIRKYGLPEKVELSDSDLIKAAAVDKKGIGNKVNLILLKKIGNAVIEKTDKQKIFIVNGATD